MTSKKLPRFYLHKDILLGYVKDAPDLQSFRAMIGRYYLYINSGRTLLFIPSDGNVYALIINTEWSPLPGYKLNSSLYKLCTRSSPQIKKEDLLTRPFIPHHPWTNQYSQLEFFYNVESNQHFGSRDGMLVDKRRHVVMGHPIDEGDSRPTWLLEFELEWLFT